MKFFAVFATLLAVTCAFQRQWSLHELSEAIQNPETDPALLPHLEAALNDLMLEMMGGQIQPSPVITPAMDVSTWTIPQLSEALQDPNTDAALLPYLEDALNTVMANLMDGNQQETVVVATPIGLLPVAPAPAVNEAADISTWSLQELSEALQDPNTDAALLPLVEAALNDMMASIVAEEDLVDLMPNPVVIPINPNPIVTPAPVVTPAEDSASSPLVQIIININQQEAAAPVVAPAPVVTPTPVAPESVAPVFPGDIIAITPPESIVNPVDAVVITPPQVVINPVDIVAITPPEAIVNPVDAVVITPPQVVINPVDVVAITPPEVNPVDIASPLPLVPAGIAVVGPIL